MASAEWRFIRGSARSVRRSCRGFLPSVFCSMVALALQRCVGRNRRWMLVLGRGWAFGAVVANCAASCPNACCTSGRSLWRRFAYSLHFRRMDKICMHIEQYSDY